MGTVRRSRVTAAVTAIAFVLAGMIGLSHEATTRHIRCAEHGELVHGDLVKAKASTVPSDHTVVDELAGKGSHDDDHCGLTYASRVAFVQSPQPALIAITATEHRVTSLPSFVAPRDGIYRTAPKTSPPA